MRPTLLVLVLAACTSGKPDIESGDDTYVFHDTDVVETADADTDSDTDSDSDTDADTDSDTDADTDSDTEADTDTATDTDTGPPPDAYLDLVVTPGSRAVSIGATYTLSCVGTLRGGITEPAEGITWISDDGAVATVDAGGLVTALTPGSTTFHCEDATSGLDATSTIEVLDQLAEITVIDAVTGAPIRDAYVGLDDGTTARSDAKGHATLPVADPGAVNITAWVDDTWSAASYMGTSSRVLTFALTQKDATTTGYVAGDVDFAGVDDAGLGQLVIGLMAPSIPGSMPVVTLAEMFSGPDRVVTMFGTDITLPSSVVIEGTVEDYEVYATPGPVGSWGFAGPIAITDISSAASSGNTGAALQVLIDNLPNMAWDWGGGGNVSAGGTATLDLAPSLGFTPASVVTVPGLPLGFEGSESWVVFSADGCPDEGWIITGMGQGASTADMTDVGRGVVDCAAEAGAVAIAEVGGLGTGGPTSAVFGPADSSGFLFATPQSIPSVDAWDPAARSLEVTVDPLADWVRVRMEDDRHNVHDYFVEGSFKGIVPGEFSGFRRARATVEVVSLSTTGPTWEELVSAGATDLHALDAESAARMQTGGE